MAGYSEHYLSDFVLHGTSDANYFSKLSEDLKHGIQNPALDEPIAENGAIVADAEKGLVFFMTTSIL